jgi:hypothetical protein
MMLVAAIKTLEAQRPYVKSRPEYQAAYRSGIRQRQSLYSETIFWQGVRAAKQRHWAEAVSCLSVLLRYDHSLLLHPPYPRLRQILRQRSSVHSS